MQVMKYVYTGDHDLTPCPKHDSCLRDYGLDCPGKIDGECRFCGMRVCNSVPPDIAKDIHGVMVGERDHLDRNDEEGVQDIDRESVPMLTIYKSKRFDVVYVRVLLEDNSGLDEYVLDMESVAWFIKDFLETH